MTTLTPKMQMGPGDYITQAFRAEMDKWLIEFFGYEEDDKQPALPQQFDDAILSVPKAKEVKAVKTAKTPGRSKSKTQVQPDMESFSALLEGLENSFHTMQIPQMKGSWLERREVLAIKKLGVYVPNPFGLEITKNPMLTAGGSFPSIASAMFIPKSGDRAGFFSPRFIYAIKSPRLPAEVEPTKGVAFKFGMCFDVTKDENGTEMPSKTFWMWCWVVIRPDGSLRIPHEMRQFSNLIRHHKNRRKGDPPTDTVHNKRWCLPSLAVAEEGRDQAEHENFMLCTFRQLLIWWGSRGDQWSVGVRKDGHRVCFSIAPEHTSAYFADRDTVVNVDGKPKKIIHFVREHTRITGATVKAHVRGLREFDWKGYHCAVTAPRLNGAIFTDNRIDPIEVARSELSSSIIQIDQVASMLADHEDAGFRRAA